MENDDSVLNSGIRRKRKAGGGDESDEEENVAPPVYDIYRIRQQKRVK